jgi:hypothetical protein
MKLRRLTGQRLPCCERIAHPSYGKRTAALRDFVPVTIGRGSMPRPLEFSESS